VGESHGLKRVSRYLLGRGEYCGGQACNISYTSGGGPGILIVMTTGRHGKARCHVRRSHLIIVGVCHVIVRRWTPLIGTDGSQHSVSNARTEVRADCWARLNLLSPWRHLVAPLLGRRPDEQNKTDARLLILAVVHTTLGPLYRQ
jgi:hypothetical protein